MTRWAILTGEYPPQAGGVADYTRAVAAGLAAAGDAVAVYAPPAAGDNPAGVAVRRLPDRFGPRGLRQLGTWLDQSRPDVLLVQYVPHAFGWKGMNLPFCLWLLWRRLWHGDRIRVMVHEIVYPLARRPLRHVPLALVTRVMATAVLHAAERVDVSALAWAAYVRTYGPRRLPCGWLPIPSGVPADAAPADVAAARRTAGADATVPVVGHFGTYGTHVTGMLGPTLARLLDSRPDVRVLLIGSGEAFRDGLTSGRSDWAARVAVTGRLPTAAVAAHLQACDLLVQPYPDGVSTRRSSMMAGLANGVPTANSDGALTESLWRSLPGVVLAPAGDAVALADAALALLAEPARLARMRGDARAAYDRHFALGHTLAALRGEAR